MAITNKNMNEDTLGNILKSTRGMDHVRSTATWKLNPEAPVEPIKVERPVQQFKDEGRDILGELASGEGQQARYVSNHGH